MKSLVQSISAMKSLVPPTQEGDSCPELLSKRLPLVVRNCLPIPIMFGQADAAELLTLQPDAERGYAWKQTNPSTYALIFALHGEAPVSAPLSFGELPKDDTSWWACFELKKGNTMQGDFVRHIVHVCVQRVSLVQCVVTVLPPVLLYSCLPYNDIEYKVMQGTSEVPCSINTTL